MYHDEFARSREEWLQHERPKHVPRLSGEIEASEAKEGAKRQPELSPSVVQLSNRRAEKKKNK